MPTNGIKCLAGFPNYHTNILKEVKVEHKQGKDIKTKRLTNILMLVSQQVMGLNIMIQPKFLNVNLLKKITMLAKCKVLYF